MARILEKKLRLKRCPSCRMVVQKSNGCDHMTCHCSYEFCYVCSQQYNINHKCQPPAASNCLQQLSLELEREDSDYNKGLHCGKILSLLAPDPERCRAYRCTYAIAFTATLYPLLLAVVLLLTLGLGIFWLLILTSAMGLFFLVYPLFEVIELELPPSLFLL
jgi:hypothetical protein